MFLYTEIIFLSITLVASHSLNIDATSSQITGTESDFQYFPTFGVERVSENITLYNYNQNYYGTNNGNNLNGRLLRLSAWKTIDYKFPSDADRQSAINSGIYNPGKLMPFGIAAIKNWVFLSLPVFFETRNPASLAYYELPSSTLSPQLQPYYGTIIS